MAAEHPGHSANRQRPRISVVNDNPEFLALMGDILEDDAEFEVQLHGSAMRIEELRQAQPDLIVVDLLLGGASGWEIVTLARADEALSEVPIIVCTADVAQLRQRANELADIGNVHVLPKPFSIDELLTLVHRLVDGRQPTGPRGAR